MTDGFVHQTEAQMTMTIRTMLLRLLFLLIVVAAEGQTCSVSPSTERDLRLVEMTYDVGDGEQTTMVYVDPPVTELYQGEPPASTKVVPKFNGLWGKFVNMSNKPITLYWESSPGGQKHEMRHQKPFSPASTATFPTHRFLICEEGQPDKVLKLFVVGDYPENIYFYDPYFVEGDPEATEKNLQVLTADERYRYDGWRKTMLFNEQYKAKTGRSYLANYLRKPPIHYIWPADYFGQEHWVTTKETHIVELPPEKELSPVLGLEPKTRQLTAESPRTLAAYRDPSQSTLNMTLKVLSTAPRVFEIENFLSDVEVAHILQLAAGIDLSLSSTGEQAAGEKKVRDDRRTRTSYNSWVPREKSPVIDIVYRRAADLLRMDEALFRFRAPDEIPELKTKKTIAEQLQLVHYDVGQEYTAHHDFASSANLYNETQDARFATLLLYLNECESGGETSFPRYQNAETFKELKVAPDSPGKAVLFYSQLPDGNLDDFSQHAALPVKVGEKWLINLWVHDPFYEK